MDHNMHFMGVQHDGIIHFMENKTIIAAGNAILQLNMLGTFKYHGLILIPG